MAAAGPRVARLADLELEDFDDPSLEIQEVFRTGVPLDRLNVVSGKSGGIVKIANFFSRLATIGLQIVFNSRRADQSLSSKQEVQDALESGLRACKKFLQFVSITEADLSGKPAIARAIRGLGRCWAVQLNNCSVGDDFISNVLSSNHVDFLELRACGITQQAADHLVNYVNTGFISILILSSITIVPEPPSPAPASGAAGQGTARRSAKRQRGDGEAAFYRDLFGAAGKLEALRVIGTAADASAILTPDSQQALLTALNDPESRLRHLALDGEIRGVQEGFFGELRAAADASPALRTYSLGSKRWVCQAQAKRKAAMTTQALVRRERLARTESETSCGSEAPAAAAGRPLRRKRLARTESDTSCGSEGPAAAAAGPAVRRKRLARAVSETSSDSGEPVNIIASSDESSSSEEDDEGGSRVTEARAPSPLPSGPAAPAEAEPAPCVEPVEEVPAPGACHPACACCQQRCGITDELSESERTLGYRVIQIRRHPDCPPQNPLAAATARLALGPEDGWQDLRTRAALLLGLPAVNEFWTLDFVKVETPAGLRHRWPYIAADLTGGAFVPPAPPASA